MAPKLVSAAFVLLLGATVGAQQLNFMPPASRVPRAESILAMLVAQDFAKVTAMFDDTMKKSLSEDQLKSGWATLLTQAGKFVQRASSVEQQRGNYTAVLMVLDFEKGKVDLTVIFNTTGQIAGLSTRPSAPSTPYAAPSYSSAITFTEREVTVGSGEWALPGTLSLPNGDGPHPAVVLVHGSGPNDRDETFGPNKTFKDLAIGLASFGVAVLRYDKRSFVYRAKMDSIPHPTVKDEAIDDALAAIALLRAEKAIDPGRIFVVGHSLGGMLAPRIAAADPKIAGLIVMAGAIRPLEQSILDQFQYLAMADGAISPQEQQVIDDAKKNVDAVAKLTQADMTSSVNISGAPASYWLDLRGFDPAAAALKLPQKMLVLQGERDYQVTMVDFGRWKATLGKKPNAQFKSYAALNHLFLPGTGKSLPSEYTMPGHVPIEVIKDIVAFITG